MTDHPIMAELTPRPPELVQQLPRNPWQLHTPSQDQVYKWWEEACKRPPSSFYEKLDYVAEQAARWGSNQELQACCEWIADNSLHHAESDLLNDLRAARRPKPKSLAEEALMGLEQTILLLMPVTGRQKVKRLDTIRRALERLQELEGQGDG